MRVIFDWDRRKAQSNRQKHKVSFEEASSTFLDPFVLTSRDEEHSTQEDRLIGVGLSERGRVLIVVYLEWYDTPDTLVIRIISSRKATVAERQAYDEQTR